MLYQILLIGYFTAIHGIVHESTTNDNNTITSNEFPELGEFQGQSKSTLSDNTTITSDESSASDRIQGQSKSTTSDSTTITINESPAPSGIQGQLNESTTSNSTTITKNESPASRGIQGQLNETTTTSDSSTTTSNESPAPSGIQGQPNESTTSDSSTITSNGSPALEGIQGQLSNISTSPSTPLNLTDSISSGTETATAQPESLLREDEIINNITQTILEACSSKCYSKLQKDISEIKDSIIVLRIILYDTVEFPMLKNFELLEARIIELENKLSDVHPNPTPSITSTEAVDAITEAIDATTESITVSSIPTESATDYVRFMIPYK